MKPPSERRRKGVFRIKSPRLEKEGRKVLKRGFFHRMGLELKVLYGGYRVRELQKAVSKRLGRLKHLESQGKKPSPKALRSIIKTCDKGSSMAFSTRMALKPLTGANYVKLLEREKRGDGRAAEKIHRLLLGYYDTIGLQKKVSREFLEHRKEAYGKLEELETASEAKTS